MTRHKNHPALRLVHRAPDHYDDIDEVEKLHGWRWLAAVIGLAVFSYACAIATGYVLVMLLRLVANAA